MIFENQIAINEEAIFSKDKKNPVYIVLSSGSSLFAKGIKAVTRSEFSHAMISFNSKLDPLYSFGTKAGGKGLGFVVNNPKDYVFDVEDAKYAVYVMFVTDKAKKAMKDALKFFIDNKDKLKYDFHGIADIWVGKTSDQRQGKWFCSRFVMFLISNATELSKAPSLWRPGDITKLENISLVNRGFNFYNYNYKVTEKHCNDIKKGKYNAGDVLYEEELSNRNDNLINESHEQDAIKYLTNGSEYYLEKEYERIYKPYHYKVPLVGFPTNNRTEYLEVVDAAKIAASSYYKFKIEDANREYPFKFFNVLDIPKEQYMKLINGNVPINKRFNANLYHINIRDENKKISVILLAVPGTIYSMYLLLPNNVLYKFNYEGIMYQEAAYCREDYKETAILASSKLKQLHEMNRMMNIHCMDIELDSSGWVFAEYTITNDEDEDNVVRFSNFINKIIESSIYEGCIEQPEKYKSYGILSISEKSIYDMTSEAVKFYKNPAKQLKVKNSKKRNDKVRTGNYSDTQKPVPKPTIKKKRPVKEETQNIEKAAEDARKLLTKEIIACKDCAYMYKDIMLPYAKDDSYAIIGWDMNKLKPHDDFDSCKNAVFGYCSKIYNQTHPEYCMDCDDNCFYIYKK